MFRKWIEFPQAEYRTWYGMIRRCHDPRHQNFPRYGGRGIRVCERWRHDFMMFLSDMRLRPSPQHSLDRCDNDGDYTPENCRWATRLQQGRSTRRVLEAVGAVRRGKKWEAVIQVNARQISLGRYATKTEARAAYRLASKHARLLADIAPASIGLPPLTNICPECGWSQNLRHQPKQSAKRKRPGDARPPGC